jgi:hypothetical protein
MQSHTSALEISQRRLAVRKHFITAALIGAAIVGAYASAVRAEDQSNHFKATLTGFQEVPAVSSTGTGTIELRIDDDAQTIEFELTYEKLEGTATSAAHIHLGQAGVNGGVSAFFCGGGGKPACTPTSGTFTGVITAADVIGPAGQGIAAGEIAELIRAIRAGVTYANVHTNKHPGGEIRADIK